MPTAPTTIDTLPTPPTTADPTNFDARQDATLLAQQAMVPQINVQNLLVYANAVEAAASATTAATQVALATAQAVAAATAASSASSTANITAWSAATAYTAGQSVYSPVNFLSYRRRVAGTTSTDPSLDPTNWALLLIAGLPVVIVSTTAVTCVANIHYVLTNAAVTTATFPLAPVFGDTIAISVDNLRTDNVINFNGQPHQNRTWALEPNMIINNKFATVSMRWVNAKWSM